MEATQSAEGGVTLSRDLRLFDITMIGVGAMIGAGIFVLTGAAAGAAGPALILAFMLNGIVTTFTAMAYAELGSAYPEAGGGYLWVKEGLGGAQGFLSGWMSWFAHVVAGSLYGLGFGHFASELWRMAGLPDFGMSQALMAHIFMTIIVILFTYLNYLGASETGTVGNVITIAKVIILGAFVVFGIAALGNTPNWQSRFTEGFLPNGAGGIFAAMGLTFIAFEGYEIIAQSGEEVMNPMRNIPRAILMSIAVVVVIYVAVAFVSIAAIQVPDDFEMPLVENAEGEMVPVIELAEGEELRTYQYLGLQGEVAVVRAAEQLMPFGAILLLISGLASTMSALNATTYSSSRVSFAMGRDKNLPDSFAHIDPRRHTPVIAVIASGALMIFLAWALTGIETVASAADIMFLLLFLQVNVALMTLRHKMPTMKRGFIVPLFPWVPLIGIVSNIALAAYLVLGYNQTAGLVTIGWVGGGLLLYYAYFVRKEQIEKPSEILHEEVLVSRDYSVMVPVATEDQARVLGDIGAKIAADRSGEVMALHVATVPQQLSLADGRVFIKEGRRQLLERVIEQAEAHEVPVHTMIRLSRKVADAIDRTVTENATNLVVLGWPGQTNTSNRVFGSVIDPIVDNPPTDIALVRYREPARLPCSILVAVAGGLNSRHAVRLAVSLARQTRCAPAASDGAGPPPVKVVLYHVTPPGAPESERVRAAKTLSYARNGVDYPYVEERLVEAPNPFDALLDEAANHDMVVVGASEEPLFRNILFGSLPEQLAREAPVTVIVVKRHSGPIHRFLRQTVLEPSSGERVTNGR
ncbi:MAG: amino acid permease [Anaerolineae bacterium]|nr:amino acid permease [Anaerolineae bacterium]